MLYLYINIHLKKKKKTFYVHNLYDSVVYNNLKYTIPHTIYVYGTYIYSILYIFWYTHFLKISSTLVTLCSYFFQMSESFKNIVTKLTNVSTRVKVSSVLQRSPEFTGKNIFVDDEVSCWCSDSGSPQHIFIDFGHLVRVHEMRMMFQGGFSGMLHIIHMHNLRVKSKSCI